MALESLWPASIAGGKLDKYSHVCAFFGSKDEEYRVLLPFIREGLERREKAMHIWNPRDMEEHRERLARGGCAVSDCEGCGQFELHSCYDVYLKGGTFDPQRMLKTVEQVISEGREQGYPRTRVIGHMDWALEGNPGSERLVEYEVYVNDVLARTRQPAVCVYDLTRVNASLMMDIMRAHPLTIIGGVLYDNPFFTSPELYLEELRARAPLESAIA